MPKYDVTSPSGEVFVVTVPEGATKEDALRYAQSQFAEAQVADPIQSLLPTTPIPAPLSRSFMPTTSNVDRGFLDAAGSAIGRGVDRLGIALGDTAPAVIASAAGYDDYAKQQLEDAERAKQNLELLNPTQVKTYKDIEVGNALTYGTESVFEQIANLGIVIGSATAGGKLFSLGAKRALKKKLAEKTKNLSKGKSPLSNKAIKEAQRKINAELAVAQAKATTRGVDYGAYFGSFALNAPEVFSNVYEATGDMSPAAALLAGSAAAALDSILPRTIVKQLRRNPALKKAVVGNALLQKGVSKDALAAAGYVTPSVLRSTGVGIGKGLALEGVTEAAQEAISIAAERIVGDNFGALSSQEFDRLIESGLRGGIAGGAFSGVGGARKGISEKAINRRVEKAIADAEETQGAPASDVETLVDAEKKELETDDASTPSTPSTPAAPVAPPIPEVELTPKQLQPFVEATADETTRLEEIDNRVAEINQKQQAEGVSLEEQTERNTLEQERADIQTKITTRAKDAYNAANPMPSDPSIGPNMPSDPSIGPNIPQVEEAPTKVEEAPEEVSLELMSEEAIKSRIADIEGYLDGINVPPDPKIVAELKELQNRLAELRPADPSIGPNMPSDPSIGPQPKVPKDDGFLDDTIAYVDENLETAEEKNFLDKQAEETINQTRLNAKKWLDKKNNLQAEIDQANENIIVAREKIGSGVGVDSDTGTTINDVRFAPLNNALRDAESRLAAHNKSIPEPITNASGEVIQGLAPKRGNTTAGEVLYYEDGVIADRTNMTTSERIENVIKARFGTFALTENSPIEVYDSVEDFLNKKAYFIQQEAIRITEKFQEFGTSRKDFTKYELMFLRDLDSGMFISVNPGDIPTIDQIKKYLRKTFTGGFGTVLGIANTGYVAFEGTNKARLFADNIPMGTELSVFMHETGVHLGLQGLFKTNFADGQTNTQLTNRIAKFATPVKRRKNESAEAFNKRKKKQKDSIEYKLAKQAIDAVDKNYNDRNRARIMSQELIAHFVHLSIEAGYTPSELAAEKQTELGKWFAKFIDFIERQFNKLIVKATKQYGQIESGVKLDPQEIVDLSFGAATAVMQLGANRNIVTYEKAGPVSVIPEKARTIEDLTVPGNRSTDTSLIDLSDETLVRPFAVKTTEADMAKPNVPTLTLANNEEKTEEKTFGVAEKITKSKDGLRNIVDELPRTFAEITPWLQDTFYNLMSVWQMSDLVKSFNPVLAQQIRELDALVKNRAYEVATAREKVQKSVQEKRELLSKVKQSMSVVQYAKLLDEMNDFAMDATLMQFDFRRSDFLESTKVIEGSDVPNDATHRQMVKRYKELPAEMQKVLTDIANENEAKREEYIQIMGKYVGENQDAQGRSVLSPRQREEFLANMPDIQPYFTLARTGGYWIRYPNKNFNPNEPESTTNRPTVKRSFDSALKRAVAIRNVIKNKEAAKEDIVKYAPSRNTNNEEQASSRILGAAIQKIKAAREQENNPGLDTVIEALNDDFLALFPASSTIQQWKQRKGDLGFNANVLEDFAEMQQKQASEFALFESAEDLNNAVDAIVRTDTSGEAKIELVEELKQLNQDPSATSDQKDRLLRQIQSFETNSRVVNEIKSRESFLHSPVAGKLPRGFSYFGYLYLIMGNISSAIIQLTQVPLVAQGILGGAYTQDDAFKALKDAFVYYNKNAGKDDNTTIRIFSGDLLPVGVKGFDNKQGFELSDVSMFAPRKGKNTPEMEKLYEASLRTASVRRSTAQEAVDLNTIQENWGKRAFLKANLAGGWLFQNTERVNKEVTLLAAYNLSKKFYPSLNTDQHIARAVEHVEQINGPALNESGPRFFQEGWGKAMGTFKKFAFSQIYLQVKLAREAFNRVPDDMTQKDVADEVNRLRDFILKNPNDSKNVAYQNRINTLNKMPVRPEGAPSTRDIARRQYLMTSITAFAFAGLRGMPFYGAVTMLIDMLFEDEDDETIDDIDSIIQRAFGDLGHGGVLSALLNIDLGSRTGFYGYMYRDDPYRREQIGDVMYLLEAAIGPTALLWRNTDKIFDLLEEGQYYRAFETALPSAIRNGLKSVRYHMEGALTKNGTPIVDDISLYNELMQFIGFTPYELAMQYRKNELMSRQERLITKKASKLKRKYFYAIYEGDNDEAKDVLDDIREFNKQKIVRETGYAITNFKLTQSVAQRRRRMAEIIDGLYINPNARPAIERELFG